MQFFHGVLELHGCCVAAFSNPGGNSLREFPIVDLLMDCMPPRRVQAWPGDASAGRVCAMTWVAERTAP